MNFKGLERSLEKKKRQLEKCLQQVDYDWMPDNMKAKLPGQQENVQQAADFTKDEV